MSAVTVEERYKRLRSFAERNGWMVPPHDEDTDEPRGGSREAWIDYWLACHAYQRNPASGRPVPPHQSGGGEPPNGHTLEPAFFHPEATKPPEGAAPEVPMPEAAPTLQEQPVFEIVIPSAIEGAKEPAHHFKLWADGRIEGFTKLAGNARSMIVVNRVPALLFTLFSPMREYAEDVCALAESLAGDAATPASNDPAANVQGKSQ